MVYRITVRGRDTVVATHVRKAESLKDRMIGLLGKPGLPEHEGLWIDPCKSIHTIGMRFPIDAIFVDQSLAVVRVIHSLGTGRVTRIHWSARSVIEISAGAARSAGIVPGDRLQASRDNT